MKIRTMTLADIPFGLSLSRQNQWNQLEADWRRQLDLEPEGCFVAELHGQPVGTACACIFGDVAWVNLVLVDQAHRGRGIGTALMKHVLAWLDARKVPTVRLDATPLGEPVYRKLGFKADFTIARYAGFLRLRPIRGVLPVKAADLPKIIDLDEKATGTRREKLLRYLYESAPDNWRKVSRDRRVDGFSFCRPGANAWQVGPIVGDSDARSDLLLHAGMVTGTFLRAPSAHVDVAEGSGEVVTSVLPRMSIQRTLVRMSRGRRSQENDDFYFASFGPEKG